MLLYFVIVTPRVFSGRRSPIDATIVSTCAHGHEMAQMRRKARKTSRSIHRDQATAETNHARDMRPHALRSRALSTPTHRILYQGYHSHHSLTPQPKREAKCPSSPSADGRIIIRATCPLLHSALAPWLPRHIQSHGQSARISTNPQPDRAYNTQRVGHTRTHAWQRGVGAPRRLRVHDLCLVHARRR